MKVLVTGATGFIGGNLVRELCRRDYQVRALVRPGSNTLTLDSIQDGGGKGIERVDGDILDAESVRRGMQGCQAVFHCAAVYTFWAKNPQTIHRANVDGTRIVLEAARQANVEKIVYTSTVAALDLPRRGLGVEDAPTGARRSPLHRRAGHYRESKYRAEQVALELADRGLPVVVVNPTAPLGPWDVKPTPTGRMVLDFIRGELPGYLNTGMNFVDVADVAAGHVLALERGEPGQRYLLGNRNLAFKKLLEMLRQITGHRMPRFRVPIPLALLSGRLDELIEGRLLGREPKIPLDGVKLVRDPMYVSCQKAIDRLGLPQNPVEAALERAVQWFTDYGYVRRD